MTRNKIRGRRLSAVAAAAALGLGLSVVLPQAASAAPSSAVSIDSDAGYLEECMAQAADAAAAANLTEDGYNFACAPDLTNDDLDIAVQVEPAPILTKEAEAAIEAASATRSTQRNPSTGACGIAHYNRQILNELQESGDFCVIYGSERPGFTWWDTTLIYVNVYPGWTGHFVSVLVDNLYGVNGEISWDTSLFRGQWGQVPTELDFSQGSMFMPNSQSFNTTVRNTSSRATGTFHVRVHRLHVEVPQYEFSINVEHEWIGHRFLCNEDDIPNLSNCRWPDGQEAF